ncbi:hypothetical protein JL720_6725 [Aureococcus anophagefferens]|nr:hypothetical protein JL720_6725 [Aureococcus anophagefferens]
MHTRRATPDDGPAISALITNCGGTLKYRKRFGTFNVANLLESGYLALVVGDRDLASSEGHQMLGFLVFSDGPRGAPMPPSPGSPRCHAPPTMKASAPFLKDFVAVPSRLGSTFSHTLFLLHRASLVAAEQLRVRRFDPRSAAQRRRCWRRRGGGAVTADGEPAPTPDQIVAGLGADFSVPLEEGPNAAAFVAVVGGAVVAVVSVSRKAASTNVLNWLKANYHIEDFVPFERHRARAQASWGCSS